MPRRASSTPSSFDTLAIIHPNAAGLDIGSSEIVAALPPDRFPTTVRAFSTFTPDLNALVDWLVAAKIDTVVMESTGVYWVPIYDLLEQRGLTPVLVNSRHVKIVPGRKSDWNDAQWLQKLHSFGLFSGSFRPDAEIVALRTLVRHRGELIQHRSPHILHMLKALTQMNIQLDLVLSDIMGKTGQAIVRAIVAGERDPITLAQLRNPACKASSETIAKALTGSWQDEHLFVLKQALALSDAYTEQVVACDAEIERTLGAMASRAEPDAPLPDLPRAKPHSKSKNQPTFTARAQFARIVGVDLVAVTGLSAATVQTIISEIGTDVSRFPTVKHFCSWLHLAPHNDISGGKVGIVNLSDCSTGVTISSMQSSNTSPYKGYRFPVESISYAVWLYFRFSLSYRDVEELLGERGIMVTHETLRHWCQKFGQHYANQLRRRRAQTGDTWHLDEVSLTINGKLHYLWRAVDQHGNVLDILVQSRRNKRAALTFFRKLLKGCQYVPGVLITDKLASYAAAKREILSSVEHRQHRRLNNRAENSHQPTRQRERTMRRFTSPGHAQRFLSAFGPIREHFCLCRHRLKAHDYRAERARRFQTWKQITGVQLAS